MQLQKRVASALHRVISSETARVTAARGVRPGLARSERRLSGALCAVCEGARFVGAQGAETGQDQRAPGRRSDGRPAASAFSRCLVRAPPRIDTHTRTTRRATPQTRDETLPVFRTCSPLPSTTLHAHTV